MFQDLIPGQNNPLVPKQVFEHRKFFGGQRDWLPAAGNRMGTLRQDKIGQLQFILGHRRPPRAAQEGPNPGKEL